MESVPVSTNQFELHLALWRKLSSFPRLTLPRGHIVFHGCKSTARDIDVASGKLMGTRKWTTEDAAYACDYGLSDRAAEEPGLLWVCRLRDDIPALFGSQSSLQEHSQWGNNFAEMFPNAFESYGHRLLGVTGSVGLVNRMSMDHVGEILLTAPEQAVEVLEILRLPREIEVRPKNWATR